MEGKKELIGLKTFIILIFAFLMTSVCLFFYYKNHAAEQAVLREELKKYGAFNESYSDWYKKMPDFLKKRMIS